MFLLDCKKTVKVDENRYGMASASMNGSVRFSLFSICNYFSLQD